MGLSFEEILGGMGRWLDRTWTDVSWWWRSRGPFSGGSGARGAGAVRNVIEAVMEGARDRVRAFSWWLTTRGVGSERLTGAGLSLSWKKSWKWMAVAALMALVFMLGRGSLKPGPPAAITESEIAALQSLRVPTPKERRVEAPTVKRESALKAWLMSALGLR